MLGLFKLNLFGMNSEAEVGENAAPLVEQATTQSPAADEENALPGTSAVKTPTQAEPAAAVFTGEEKVQPGTSEIDSRKSLAPTKTYTVLTNAQCHRGSRAKMNQLPPPLLYPSTGGEEAEAGTSSTQFKRESNRALSSPHAPGGFKSYKASLSKSNRNMVLNAIERSIFPGPPPGPDAKAGLLGAIKATPSDVNHFLILFRNAERCPYRGLYVHALGKNVLERIHGVGPAAITGDKAIDKFLKYNSASKAFEVVDTKHLSITMDGFTVANSFWTGNKGGGKKQGAPRQ